MREPVIRVRDAGGRARAAYDVYVADATTGALEASPTARVRLRPEDHVRAFLRTSFYGASMTQKTRGTFFGRSMFRGSIFHPPSYVKIPAGQAYAHGRMQFGAKHVDDYGNVSGAVQAATLLVVSRAYAPRSVTQAASASVSMTIEE